MFEEKGLPFSKGRTYMSQNSENTLKTFNKLLLDSESLGEFQPNLAQSTHWGIINWNLTLFN